MKVSVIIPVYNTEKYLTRCLDSVINQTYRDLEILVIDDGSTDGSGKIADEYAKKDNRVRVFHKANGGVSSARNLGLREAAGEFIAFVDSDDVIRPTMYKGLVSVCETHHVDIVTGDFIVDGVTVANSLDANRVYSENEIRETVLPAFTHEGTIGIMEFKTKLFRTELIKGNEIWFYEGFSFQEDLMFMINIYAYAKSLYYLPEAFYEYYPISGGLYTSYRENGGERFIEARKLIVSLIQQYEIPNIDWNTFNNGFLYNISFYVYRTTNYVKDKKKQKSLINHTLSDETVVSCCKDLAETATSFDRRIATAIAKHQLQKAIFLIKFVYSGKAAKLQKVVSEIRGNQ